MSGEKLREQVERCPERERCLTEKCLEGGYLCGFEIAGTVKACPKRSAPLQNGEGGE